MLSARNQKGAISTDIKVITREGEHHTNEGGNAGEMNKFLKNETTHNETLLSVKEIGFVPKTVPQNTE